MIDFSRRITDQGTLVIRLGGELDTESSDYFFGCVEDEITNGRQRIVINCADLGYISSVGLGTLIRARARVAKAEGNVFLACVESRVMDLFHVVHFDRVFKIYATEEEAIAEIEKVSG
jgi:anti-sigma B factor antagonist